MSTPAAGASGTAEQSCEVAARQRHGTPPSSAADRRNLTVGTGACGTYWPTAIKQTTHGLNRTGSLCQSTAVMNLRIFPKL